MSEIFSHDCDQGDCDSCSGTVAHKDGQPCDCSCHEDGALCEYCGDNPVDRAVQMRDATPTDRGDRRDGSGDLVPPPSGEKGF